MVARNKINSKEDKEIIENDSKNAEILNNFSNIVKNLKTPDYSNFEPFADNVKSHFKIQNTSLHFSNTRQV